MTVFQRAMSYATVGWALSVIAQALTVKITDQWLKLQMLFTVIIVVLWIMACTVDSERFRIHLRYRIFEWKKKHGWVSCPKCFKFVKPKWVKDWVYHPEEPPLFFHYECPKCGAQGNIEPSMLSERAVRRLGFKDFQEFSEYIAKRKGEQK